MESLINVLKLFFRQVSSKDIMMGMADYSDFEKEYFKNLTLAHLEHYSGNEAENLFLCLKEELGNMPYTDNDKVNVFDALRVFDEWILKEVEEIPVCRYRYLLNWRLASFDLEEELFTTSFLAWRDQKKGRNYRCSFNWKYIIGNDNVELNNILKRGLVDNHFHLKGSAPYFYMSWINLMNQVNNSEFIKVLKEYDESRQDKFSVYHSDAAEDSLELLHMQAALIRLYLFTWMTNRNIYFMVDNFVPFVQIDKYIDWKIFDGENDISVKWKQVKRELVETNLKEWDITYKDDEEMEEYAKSLSLGLLLEKYNEEEKNCLKKRRIQWIIRNLITDMKVRELSETNGFMSERGLIYRCFASGRHINLNRDFVELFILEKEQKNILEWVALIRMEELLNNENRSTLLWYRDRLQMEINNLHAEETAPYGDSVIDYIQNVENRSEEDLYGERWFLYRMFRKLYQRDQGALRRGNLFYAYLVIKERIRSELIQVNGRVGFDNFLRYQNRKEEFIENTLLAEIYNRHAITSSFEGQPLKILEARITPRNNAQENYDYIEKLDKGILGGNSSIKFIDGQSLTEKDYFYVFHFVKEPDRVQKYDEFTCRHMELRRKVKKQAIGIYEFRFHYPEMAGRVYGIDACSPEIGCRPEVFAQAFRYLKYEQNFMKEMQLEKRRPRLRSTYHVGEDFLDIVDGMRAIDEAVFYLNLTHGDRLGHALALGISPKQWYQFKGGRVLCSRQDLLDNTVWIYQKIRKYNIDNTETIMMELRRRFVHLYQEIYGTKDDNSRWECDIDIYYDAWKLRGDDPQLYYTGELEKEDWTVYALWDEYAKNIKYRELEKIRRESICVKLYYRYHYDVEVKKRGAVVIENKVNKEMVGIIEKIQYFLQMEIQERGLAIETNPSSNYLISTFPAYDVHPIMKWYNKRLLARSDKVENCPQIDVTINTDDQAVFGTSLENEYALMAIALEKATDENGDLIYKKDMVYDWLDNIRKIGITRCFRQFENDSEIF